MTPEKQRIKLAEAVGYESIIFRGILGNADYIGYHPKLTPEGQTGRFSGQIPDFLNDLNAVHEAEVSLASSGYDDFVRHEVATDANVMTCHLCDTYLILATAPQRCRALLKYIVI